MCHNAQNLFLLGAGYYSVTQADLELSLGPSVTYPSCLPVLAPPVVGLLAWATDARDGTGGLHSSGRLHVAS